MAIGCYGRKSPTIQASYKTVSGHPGEDMPKGTLHFAHDWIDSWNSHELDPILSHYSDQFEMSSPVIIQVAGEPSGTLKGKEAVGAYWAKALSLIPDLRFELLSTLIGVNSIVLYYKGAGGRLDAEVFLLALTRKYRERTHTMRRNDPILTRHSSRCAIPCGLALRSA